MTGCNATTRDVYQWFVSCTTCCVLHDECHVEGPWSCCWQRNLYLFPTLISSFAERGYWPAFVLASCSYRLCRASPEWALHILGYSAISLHHRYYYSLPVVPRVCVPLSTRVKRDLTRVERIIWYALCTVFLGKALRTTTWGQESRNVKACWDCRVLMGLLELTHIIGPLHFRDVLSQHQNYRRHQSINLRPNK